jgi:hypothetical protein
VKKTFVANVMHTHKEGSTTYVCKTEKIARSVAGKIVLDNIHEFFEGGVDAHYDGIEALELIASGNYLVAMDLYNERISDHESLEIEVKLLIHEEAVKFDKKALLEQIAKLKEKHLQEAPGGEEESEAKGSDESGSAQVTNSEAGGVSDRGDGSHADPARQGTP